MSGNQETNAAEKMCQANTCAIWFTYEKEGDMALESARSINHFMGIPYARMLFADDVAAPMKPDVAGELMERGARVLQTSFPRKRNLNGIECIVGMLRVMRDHMEASGATYIVKLDPDTAVFSDFIYTAVSPTCMAFGGSCAAREGVRLKWAFYGLAYVLRRDLVEELIDFFMEHDERTVSKIVGISARLPEDVTISAIAHHLHPGNVHKLRSSPRGGFHHQWRYAEGAALSEAYRNYEVVTFGRKSSLKVKAEESAYKIILATMTKAISEAIVDSEGMSGQDDDWMSRVRSPSVNQKIMDQFVDMAMEQGKQAVAKMSFSRVWNPRVHWSCVDDVAEAHYSVPVEGDFYFELRKWSEDGGPGMLSAYVVDGAGEPVMVEWTSMNGDRMSAPLQFHMFHMLSECPKWLRPEKIPQSYVGGLFAILCAFDEEHLGDRPLMLVHLFEMNTTMIYCDVSVPMVGGKGEYATFTPTMTDREPKTGEVEG